MPENGGEPHPAMRYAAESVTVLPRLLVKEKVSCSQLIGLVMAMAAVYLLSV